MSGGNIKEEKKQEEAEAKEFSIQFNMKLLNRTFMLQPPLPSFPSNSLNPTLAEVTPKRSKPGRQGVSTTPVRKDSGIEFVPVTRKCVNCRAWRYGLG